MLCSPSNWNKSYLSTAKRFKKGTLWCVFQHHTYSRTISLLDEFAEAFYSADKVIITDIYALEKMTQELYIQEI